MTKTPWGDHGPRIGKKNWGGGGGGVPLFFHKFFFPLKCGWYDVTFCADFEYHIYIALKLKLDENLTPILSPQYLKIGIYLQCFEGNKPRGCMDFS
jgi:hypothetical protein